MKAKLLCTIVAGLLSPFISRSQCGTDPASGTTSVSTSSQILNTYYAGLGNPTIGQTSLTVNLSFRPSGNPAIVAGDLILIIQMQGADINSTNSDAYGDGTPAGDASGYLTSNLVAGIYEYNTVASVSGSTVNLSYSLANNYFTRAFASGAIQTYQVIRVPRAFNLSIAAGGSVTASAWDGTTGGVVVLDAANVLTINGSVNVAARGFRGGGGINFGGATTGNTNGTTALGNTDYRWNSPVTLAANTTGGAKGEGIAGTPVYILDPGAVTVTTGSSEGYLGGSLGRGAPGNAGGGATDGAPVGASQNQYNTGGGGGANAGSGGRGGSGWHGGAGNVNTYPYGGFGGSAFTQRSPARLIMGGGGGAGTANNSTPAIQYMSSGGTGGGIILLRAVSYAGTGSLNANGGDAIGVSGAGGNTDAAGGGGAGGTIVAVTRANVTVGLNGITATANGGRGGNMETHFDHGPGGGGGGGYIVSNGTFATTSVTGGANGLTRTGSASGTINNVYGATAGSAGQVQTLAAAPRLRNLNSPGSACGVLPITLSTFTATAENAGVTLYWEVESAIDFSHFEIEHSTDGLTFSYLGTSSHSTSTRHYSYTHASVIAPVNYYRLKLINANGSFTYSHILPVRSQYGDNDVLIYPQPGRTYVNVSLTSNHRERILVRITNAAGYSFKDLYIQLNAGSNNFRIDNLHTLTPGIYLLRTNVNGKAINKKIVIAR